MSKVKFFAGEKVNHAKFGEGFIRILKPFEKSFVEFNGNKEVWVDNSELLKQN
ncbi:MAG TPA: hypothetical protein VHO66_03755 [Ruminiclostridium sp.]|nr:hypothetical protein [Ruminiclostridium sp.]